MRTHFFASIPCALSLFCAASPGHAEDMLSYKEFGPWSTDHATMMRASRHDARQTPIASMPMSGSATYSGRTKGSAVETPFANAGGPAIGPTVTGPARGDISMTMNFSNESMTGQITNIEIPKLSGKGDHPLGPSLATQGNISGNTLSGGVGTFSNFFPLLGTISGTFRGPSAQRVEGDWNVSGFIPQSPTPISHTDITINADFRTRR